VARAKKNTRSDCRVLGSQIEMDLALEAGGLSAGTADNQNHPWPEIG